MTGATTRTGTVSRDRNTSRFGYRHFRVGAEDLTEDHQRDTRFVQRLTGEAEQDAA